VDDPVQVTLQESSSILKDWRNGLDIDSVLRGQGADPALIRSRRPAVAGLAERALAEGMPLLDPIVIYRRLPVESVRHERIALRGGRLLTGKLVAQHLAAAQEIVALAATIGSGVEDFISQVLKHDTVFALALDGFGNAAINTLATATCHYFSEAAATGGMDTTIPLSPGMMGWPLEVGQKEIFAVLDTDGISLKLTPHGVMIPRKSLSMVVGLGPEVLKGAKSCDYCSMQATCRYQDHYGTA
jgi:hypothetical protein